VETNLLPFEPFHPSRLRVSSPSITISQRTGKLGFNSPSARLLKEAEITSALLLWDASQRIIAIRAPKKGEKPSGKVSFNRDHHSAGLTSKEFFRFIGWETSQNESIPATWNAKEKQLEATIPAEFLGTGRSSSSTSGKRAAKRAE
jgi:hypothetical protein